MLPNFQLGTTELEKVFTEVKIADFFGAMDRLNCDSHLVSELCTREFGAVIWLNPIFKITALGCRLMEINGYTPEIIFCLHLQENIFTNEPTFLPGCCCYLRLKGERIALGLDQELLLQHTSKIVREQRIESSQLAGWSQKIFLEYCSGWLQRNPKFSLSLSDLVNYTTQGR